MRHIIQKQIFDLWVHREVDALALQQRVIDRFWMDIIPELVEQFDKMASTGDTIRLDRLEIDLGDITEEMIDSGEWVVVFREKLEAAIQETMSDVGLGRGGKILPAVDSSFDQWIYFITRGYLPWNAARPSAQWLQEVLESLGLNYQSAVTLRKLLGSDVRAVERIVLHHTPEFIAHLVELLTAEKQSSLPAAIAELASWLDDINLKHSPVTDLTAKAIERKVWIRLLQSVATSETRQNTPAIITSMINRWLQLTPQQLVVLLPFYPVAKFPLIEPVITRIAKETGDDATEVQPGDTGNELHHDRKTEIGKHTGRQDDNPDTTAQRGQIPEKAFQQISTSLAKQKSAEDTIPPDLAEPAKEGIYITHAGLVLLHPFLHTFFRKFELVSEGRFIDEAARERAVCLLHELAASGTAVQEYDLVLEKLLCNWPVHLPVDTTIELTVTEKEEAQRLLTAAIEQWEILKNASTAALQETFLQRAGKLHYKNNTWYLQVEKLSVDILVSHLPWTIGMIKLPWMKELLIVEWT